MKSTQFTIMHSKAIKDVKYCPAGNGLLLTASQDMTLKITRFVRSTFNCFICLHGLNLSPFSAAA